MGLPLRFKMKTLLLVVTLSAVACATMWQFWPRYRAYRARMRFEAAASQFSAGMTVNDVSAIVGHGEWNSYSSDANGAMVGLTPYFLDGAWYCVYMRLDANTGEHICSAMPSTSVEVFRLTVPTKSYAPQTQAAKDEILPPETVMTHRSTPTGVIQVRASPKHGEDALRAAYIQDFYEHISGRTSSELGIAYERLVATVSDQSK